MDCEVCGNPTHDDHPSCVFCYMSGRYFSKVLSGDGRSNMLDRIRATEGVLRAEVWHHHMGMFVLMVEMEDNRKVLVGAPAVAEDGERWAFPAIAPEGEPWALVVMNEDTDEQVVMEGEFSDDQVVETIANLVALV